MKVTAHAAMIQFWCDAYVGRVGAKYPFHGGKDGSAIKWLREIYSDEDIRVYMTAFFEMDDPFFDESGFALSAFRGCLPKVIAYVQKQKPKADMNGHLPPCRSWGECQSRKLAEAKRDAS